MQQLSEQSALTTATVASPWVILSSGAKHDDFATSIEWACSQSGSGFFAGRAVWANHLAATDVETCLKRREVERLQHFADVASSPVPKG